MTRHYGLDWLRVGAFAILILYHVGMVFVPWDYHVKLPGADWVAVPMLASNPWRLALLFLVSGYASRALLARSDGTTTFGWNRTKRLLVPLAFGVVFVVPAQPWVELVTKNGYPHGLAWFWLHDYFRFSRLGTLDLPTWNHLWFVGYLWLYTLVVALLIAVSPRAIRTGTQDAFDRVFRGVLALLLPTLWFVAVTTWLFPGARETHALFDDWVAHATYLPAFLFGFALARSEATIATFVRWWKPAALIAVASYALVVWIELHWTTRVTPRPWGSIFSAARAVQGWLTIAALIGFADTHWNRDARWRALLTEAVFPFYIVHQTIIVLVAYWLIPAGLSPIANFTILVVATIAGCWTFYLMGRRIGWIRPLIGLRAA